MRDHTEGDRLSIIDIDGPDIENINDARKTFTVLLSFRGDVFSEDLDGAGVQYLSNFSKTRQTCTCTRWMRSLTDKLDGKDQNGKRSSRLATLRTLKRFLRTVFLHATTENCDQVVK